MKISRSIGRSYTSFHDAAEELDEIDARSFKRGHKTNRAGADRPSEKIDDLAQFLKTDPKTVIRQSVSIIDKILNKKENIKQMPKCLILAREELGQALRAYYRNQGHPAGDDEHKGHWDWKLHPYSKGESLGADLPNGKDTPEVLFSKSDRISGKRWKKAFWIERDGQPHYSAIAAKIYAHLFVSRFRLADGQIVTNNQADNSLIDHRARSIEKSVFRKRKINDVVLPDQNGRFSGESYGKGTAVAVYWSESDVAAELYDQCLALENDDDADHPNKRTRISNSDVGQVLYRHFGRVLGHFTVKLAMEDGVDPKEIETEEVPGYNDFLILHQHVKDFYSHIVKKSKRGRNEPGLTRRPLSSLFPRNNLELQKRLKQRKANATIMDLIRHGRVEYYTWLAARDGNPVSDGHFWTSEGQAEIKRLEAVSRAWRTTLIQAQRTLQSWADPENTFCIVREDFPQGDPGDYDVLNSSVIGQLTDPEVEPKSYHETKISLLFGKHANLFAPQPGSHTGLSKPALELCLRGLAGLRNDVFHFSNLRSFKEKTAEILKKPNNLIRTNRQNGPAVIEAFNKLLAADNEQRSVNLLRDVDAFEIRKYASSDELEAFIKLVVDAKSLSSEPEKDAQKPSAPVILPRFNKILARWENVRGHVPNDARAGLPDAASFSGLQDQWANCKFNSAKLLYETGFRAWLSSSEVTAEQKIRDHLNAARQQSTMLARKPQGKTRHSAEVQSQSLKFGDIEKGESLAQFFGRIDGMVATENRDNQRYEPNREAAAAKSKWIMDFKCDFFAIIFADFLDTVDRNWILQISAKTEPTKGTYNFSLPEFPQENFETWHANFYALLHLIPIDDVSRLLHQLRKSAILGNKADEAAAIVKASDPAELENLIILFLDMYDDKFDGAATGASIAPFRDLFDDDSQFERFYATTADGDHLIQSTQRGLRRILRHGDFGVLKKIFLTSKITLGDLKIYDEMTTASEGHLTQIARLQQERKEEVSGRDSLAKVGRLSLTDPRLDPYMQKVNEIKVFRDAASRIRLADHVEVHSIMTRVLARMIDYFGTWERDRFFVFLALKTMQSSNGKPYLLDETDNNSSSKERVPKLKLNGNLKHQQMVDLLDSTQRKYFLEYFSQDMDTRRNSFCHFDVLRHDGNGRDRVGLIDWMNALRDALNYDRKLKNSVTKSVIDLFEKEGFKLSLRFQDHSVSEAVVESKSIRHLKNAKPRRSSDPTSEELHLLKKLEEQLKSTSLVGMVEKLM